MAATANGERVVRCRFYKHIALQLVRDYEDLKSMIYAAAGFSGIRIRWADYCSARYESVILAAVRRRCFLLRASGTRIGQIFAHDTGKPYHAQLW